MTLTVFACMEEEFLFLLRQAAVTGPVDLVEDLVQAFLFGLFIGKEIIVRSTVLHFHPSGASLSKEHSLEPGT